MALWLTVTLLVVLDPGLRPTPRVQVADNWIQHRIKLAVLGAEVRLQRPECHRVLTDFQDAEGRPLLERLAATNLTPSQYLFDRVWFVDGSATPQCRRDGRTAAFTAPGHQVVRVCAERFKRFERQTVAAEMIVIHEMLHTLGLGENPPTSHEITERIMRRCGVS